MASFEYVKIGDGVTPWSQLPYVAGIQGAVGPQGPVGATGATGAAGTIVTADTLQFQFNPSAGSIYPQVRGNGATPVINYSGFASLSGQSAIVFNSGGTTLSATSWTSFFTTNMGSGGDSTIINVQETTNSRIYRVTYCRGTLTGNGSGTIFVERLL